MHDLDDKKLKNTRPVRKERKKPSNWQEPAAAIEDFKDVRFDFIFQGNQSALAASERQRAESCHRRGPKTVSAQTAEIILFSLNLD